jgi:hypothetical protein
MALSFHNVAYSNSDIASEMFQVDSSSSLNDVVHLKGMFIANRGKYFVFILTILGVLHIFYNTFC